MQDDRIRDLLKKVSLELQQSRRDLATLENDRREPIAIVGIGCRFPGGAEGPDSFWRLLDDERDAVGEFPADRGWDLATLFDEEQGPGTSTTAQGGFLSDIAGFDAGLFGVSPREALASDPQHRLLLETTWQAFEHAGIDPTGLRGSRTGVFIGTNGNDYPSTLSGYPPELEGYLGVGNAASVASGRISYSFGLEGPALTVDTACSASLVATHLAVRSLRERECDSAVIGGVTLMSSPALFVEFSRQHGLARDGRCKAFGDGADGTGWAEGVGVLVAERLSDARAAGRRILAVIRGSAVNQDGASNGLTAPNGPAQQRVIEDALASAGLLADDIDAVEAHGTGTALGDPIEAHALLATYGRRRGRDPLWLGSVKSNIGHTQAAAGIAGLIKMVLALGNERLPRTLHADRPSTKIDWTGGNVRILDTARPWPRRETPRRAGVSAFGVSGTNAHILIEEAPDPVDAAVSGNGPETVDPAASPPGEPAATALLLSARSPKSLAGQAAGLLAADRVLDAAPGDIASSLRGRALLGERAVVVGSTGESLRRGLAALAGDGLDDDLVRGTAATGRRTVFVFPGQGSQWAGMADSLLESSPEFATYLGECAEALEPFVDWSLLDVLTGAAGAPDLDRVDVVQPVLWAMMVSLAKLWIHLGVRPQAVIGHSQGEIAAAHIAGALSLRDSARVVALRSRAITRIAGRGGMLSVALSEADVRTRLSGRETRLSVAAVNGPGAVVVAGDDTAIGELAAELDRHEIWHRRVNVDYASHSHHVDAVQAEVLDQLAPITSRSATIPLLSTVTGAPIDTTTMGAQYWYTNLRSTVLFDTALRRALADDYDTVVEVSPHPVLRYTVDAIAETVGDVDFASTGTLRRERSGRHELLLAAARLHVRGIEVNWDALLPVRQGNRVELPTYAFDRQRYWGADDSTVRAVDARRLGVHTAAHPLLGGVVEISASGATLFVGQIALSDQPWLADHAVGDTVVVPGAACVDIALWIGAELGLPDVAELVNERPITVPESGRIRVQVYAGPEQEGRRAITFFTADDADGLGGEWQQCASGVLAATAPGPAPDAGPGLGVRPADPTTIYARLADLGLNYGPAFQGLRAVTADGDALRAVASLPGSHEAGPAFSIHPALLDSALHAIPYFQGELALPFSWSGVRLWAREARELSVRVTGLGDHTFGVIAVDPQGAPVVTIESVSLRPVAGLAPPPAAGVRPHRVSWRPLQPVEPTGSAPAAVLLTEHADRHRDSGIRPVTALSEVAPANTALVLLDTAELGDDTPTGSLAAEVHAITARALARLREWLAHDNPGARLAVLVRCGQAVLETDAPDLRFGALAGLVRAAQTENPGRFLLVDHDGTADHTALADVAATAVGADESEVGVRAGHPVFVPRLEPVSDTDPGTAEDPVPDGPGTALIVGGLGLLGRMTALELADRGDVSTVVLVSRRGPADDQAMAARAELEAVGVGVEVVACDAADRAQLAAVLAVIPDSRPLTAVVHAAGALADRPLHSLTPEALHEVLRSKVDIAWNLHELTAGIALRSFVLFSSAAGTLGIAGQSNYAAANTFLDSLAQYRRGTGSPASSLAWGLWESASALTGHLRDADRQRLARQGVRALTSAVGVGLLRQCLRAGSVDLVPVDLVAAQWQDTMSPILRGALRYRPALRQAAADRAGDAQRLRALAGREQAAAVDALVLEHAAAVLGYDTPAAISATSTFKDLGMDSLTAVELRNRLARALEIRLAATVVFDHPTPVALAAEIGARLAGAGVSPRPRVRTAPSAAAEEPVAVVGMGCRYPGGVRSAGGLWDLVVGGVDAVSGWPGDRGWDGAGLFSVDRGRAGSSYVRAGGFVEGMADFDAGLFGMSPREALATDPQQRQLLEVTWETLEGAGIDPLSLRGSNTGVYTGIVAADYADGYWTAVPPELEGYVGVGTMTSVASGRVAYTFGLQGPAISVDTACSSSLVSIHLAVAALRNRECDLALAGGVTLLTSPAGFIEFSRQRGLSPDGRCRSFAAGADGTGWAEGVGMVLLQRLSDARRSGREILAVIRSTAINQDGASNGLTAPNGAAQQQVIRRALESAGLDIGEVDAVEAHGTGTVLGDPIEANALLGTYGRRTGAEPLYVGSLKSNIGHTAAAAGVGGVIKMVEALRRGVLPASLHVDRPTDLVDWESGSVRVLTESRPWPETGRARRAGVSAFGVSGTNAHVILEQAPVPSAPPADEGPTGETTTAWPLSGHTASALRRQARDLARHIREHPSIDTAAVAHTLITSRARLAHRAVVVAAAPDEFVTRLTALADGSPTSTTVHGARKRDAVLGYMFTGQGSQRPGMGSALARRYPVFADTYAQVLALFDARLRGRIEGSLPELIRTGPAATLDRTVFAQPALFAFEVALFRLLESWGARPAYLCGHSIGEIAAAHVAGVMTLDVAVDLVVHRATSMFALPAGGAMLAVEMSVAELDSLADWRADLDLAAVNGPTSLVVAGGSAAVERLRGTVLEQGRRARILGVSHAFHSRLMDPMSASFEQALAPIEFAAPRIPLVSTVTGTIAPAEEIGSAGYWVRQVRRPVLFRETVRELARLGVTHLVELGPDAHLTPHALATSAADASDSGLTVTAAVRRDRDEVETVLLAAARLELGGTGIDWNRATGMGRAVAATTLPTYPFERERYWLPPGPAALAAVRRTTAAPEPAAAAAPEPAPEPEPAAAPELAGEPVDPVALSGADLLHLVRRAGAEVLGLDDPARVGDRTSFAELGMTSLAAVELTEKLRARLRIDLAASAPIEFPTPAELAAHLEVATAGTGSVRAVSDHSLPTFYLELNRRGEREAAAALIVAASHTRDSFDGNRSRELTPPPVRLSPGDDPAAPLVVCFPALTAMSGPHEFAGFARALGENHPVYAMEAPGYRPDSSLPADLRTYLHAQAEAISAAVGDRDFVVVGRSLGGCVAHAVTTELIGHGRAPLGLALIDTYPIDTPTRPGKQWWMAALIDGMLRRIDDLQLDLAPQRLTTMGAYLRLTADLAAEPIPVPTLLVRAADRLPGMPTEPGVPWQADWPYATDRVDVPGDHFSVLESCSADTAAAVGAWIRALAAEPVDAADVRADRARGSDPRRAVTP
ncbi:type I polyketide synthase [Nocardia sp. NBC_00416]|uniref:type I polyketide synthase n=1 Tax=Nocardia sp. NBC_00416 TaxID=2975991 RepID=UPI002E1D742C